MILRQKSFKDLIYNIQDSVDSASSLEPDQRTESISSLGSLLEVYNDQDLEKTNASLVAVLTVSIVVFFVLIFSVIFVLAVSLPPVHQGRLITKRLCQRIPEWTFLANSTDSWCDERIFLRPFQPQYQCPCFSPQLRPDNTHSIWPYTGLYVNQ